MKMEDGENAEITMYGEVVETHPTHWYTGEKLKGDYIAQDEFLQDLNSLAGARSLTIRMNSLGGDSLVGMVIHNRLRELSAKGTKLVCIVDGAAMSAASVIMSACSEVRINPASLVMIHRCWGYMWGGYNADNLREAANMFDAYDRAAVTTYQRKTGLDEAELLRLMSETTYLTGREAVEKGFADKLLEDAEPLDIAASADGRSLFVRGRQFHLTPGMFAPDTIPTVTPGAPAPAAANTNPPAQTGSEGGRTMANNLEELRAENPELAAALMAEAEAACRSKAEPAGGGAPAPQADANAVTAAVQAEQKRIREIDEVSALYDADTVRAAKYGENACTAQEMTYRAAQRAAQQGKTFLAAMEDDAQASGTQGVPAAGDPGTPSPNESKTSDRRMAEARAEVKALFGKEEK
ncbi:MAG: Clp protease ClpP [Oscillospiraceae bacterium]|nr:Clp protease ClpP [Oscillospiraceae bacterium]